MAVGKLGALILAIGKGKSGPPKSKDMEESDDSPDSSKEGGDDAVGDIFDALMAKDKVAFSKAFKSYCDDE